MFTALSERLTATLKRLTGRGVLSEQDVTEALREMRRHLLEADVSFEVTTGFVERVRERAVGVIAVKSVSPGQQVAKLVHDEIAALLGGTKRTLDFAPVGPTVILLVGLQGSGKTTTAAKLARRLKLEQKWQPIPIGRRLGNSCDSWVSRWAFRCSAKGRMDPSV